jgi:uncharacterized protein (UPF0261 family)
MGTIYVVGTADTKGEELAHLAGLVRALGATAVTVDVGVRPATVPVDISAREVAGPHIVSTSDRGQAVETMAAAFAEFIAARSDVGAIVGIGGSGGTSIVTAGMRRLPIGVPKLMVSTLAGGDVAAYVGVSDIIMMPTITDLAGLNRISRVVLANAAHAIVGMAAPGPLADATGKPAIGLTMFGVTTPAVMRICELLKDSFEPIVFHATGAGGQSMEALVEAGLLSGVVDITTTEIADLLCGGVLPALPTRLDCIARMRIPWVGSVGACDMINFRGPDTVPAQYAGRLFYRHNAQVMLMRTTPEENRAIGAFIADKINACDGPIRFLIPEQGISALDAQGQPFRDPEADEELFTAIEFGVRWTESRRLLKLPMHINDPAFADAAAAAFREISAAILGQPGVEDLNSIKTGGT